MILDRRKVHQHTLFWITINMKIDKINLFIDISSLWLYVNLLLILWCINLWSLFIPYLHTKDSGYPMSPLPHHWLMLMETKSICAQRILVSIVTSATPLVVVDANGNQSLILFRIYNLGKSLNLVVQTITFLNSFINYLYN